MNRSVRGSARVHAVGLTVAAVLASLLVSCAPAANPDWQPPSWPGGGNVTLASDVSGSDGAADAEAGDGADAAPVIDTATLQDLGFYEGRVRNDGASLQARFAEIPGDHPFNDLVKDRLRAAVQGTGVAFQPEAFPQDSGLADRGCVAGSYTSDAAELLADPSTGPTSGTGTAVVCEVLEAFDSVVVVGMRTVTGGPDAVSSDTATVLYGDVASGEAYDGSGLWVEGAAEQLWQSVVASLRREAGALSAAPAAAPDEAQLALASAALASARFGADGTVTVRLPAGIDAPEFAELGVEPTTEAAELVFEANSVTDWLSAQGAALPERLGTEFAGLPPWTAAHPVDCAILTCVALTYDDGPSGHTNQLLDTLQQLHAPATFYMLGGAAAGAPETVQRAAAEGHELGSHTMTHPELTLVSPGKAAQEVNDAANLLTELTGQSIATYRPPYGAVNAAVMAAVDRPAILWRIDTNDWQRPGVDELIRRSVDPATPGAIILYHDTHLDSVTAAPTIIEGLTNRGFTMVTVSQLFDGNVPGGRVTGR